MTSLEDDFDEYCRAEVALEIAGNKCEEAENLLIAAEAEHEEAYERTRRAWFGGEKKHGGAWDELVREKRSEALRILREESK